MNAKCGETVGLRGPHMCDGHHRESAIQNNSGLPQGPADPSAGRPDVRQTARMRCSLAAIMRLTSCMSAWKGKADMASATRKVCFLTLSGHRGV